MSLEGHRLPEVKVELRELGRQVRELHRAFGKLDEKIDEAEHGLRKEIAELRKWMEVVAFWAALSVELFKARVFQCRALSDQEYAQYKAGWERFHDLADKRIEAITGTRVWKRRFDPTSV